MSVLLHTANLGIGKTSTPVLEKLASVVAAQSPDLLVISGNITAHGLEGEFAKVQEYLAALAVPVLSVCGSTDIPRFNLPQRLLNPYKNYRRYISPMLDTVYEDDDVFLVGLTTARPFLPHLKYSNGMVLREQVHFLNSQFQKAPHHKARICVLSHPLVAHGADSALIWGSTDLLSVLESQQVDVVLSACAPQAANGLGDVEEHKPVLLGASGALARKGKNLENMAYNGLQISGADIVCNKVVDGRFVQQIRLARNAVADEDLMS